MRMELWQLALRALVVALVWVPGQLQAQAASGEPARDGTAAAWRPVIFAYFLRQAGEERLDPFGVEGRREVLQLMMQGSPQRGLFRRARLDRLGASDDAWREEGWYEIRGGVITLYHADAMGATGRIESGRYLQGRICLRDGEDGRLLVYEFEAPAGGDAPRPPPAPGAATRDGCAAEPSGAT